MKFTMVTINRVCLCLLACFAVAACETINEKRKVDYKNTRTLPPLEVPPDLPSIPETGLPSGTPASKATYSEFVTDKKATPLPGTQPTPILPQASDIRMERDGQARWLVVQASPESLFPRVREFVSSVGLIVDRENPVAGVIETDWTENRAKVGTGGQMLLAKWLGTFYATGTRDKYRIRLERGAQPGTTEVYLAHRGMEEVVSRTDSGGESEATRWQPRASDPDSEAEMLRLLIVYLGKTEDQAKTLVAQGATPPAERARLTRRGDDSLLSLDDSLDRAWRRVGLSLDRAGFTVEDRDRSKGIYYVRYIDPDKDSGRPGFFARLFGAEDKKSDERYQIHLQSAGAGSSVAVKGKDGAPETGKTGERILGLLYEQLK